jgi:hypothetical protein
MLRYVRHMTLLVSRTRRTVSTNLRSLDIRTLSSHEYQCRGCCTSSECEIRNLHPSREAHSMHTFSKVRMSVPGTVPSVLLAHFFQTFFL